MVDLRFAITQFGSHLDYAHLDKCVNGLSSFKSFISCILMNMLRPLLEVISLLVAS
jgi:hypothetical protein